LQCSRKRKLLERVAAKYHHESGVGQYSYSHEERWISPQEDLEGGVNYL
jgi:hypothetical protein